MPHFGVNYGMLFTAWGVGGFAFSRRLVPADREAQATDCRQVLLQWFADTTEYAVALEPGHVHVLCQLGRADRFNLLSLLFRSHGC